MVIFIVPVYNEVENITSLLKKTKDNMAKEKLPYKVVIVNDGSTDKTLQVAESMAEEVDLDICSYYPNKGVGEAFLVGFKRALEIGSDGDMIVTKEADNTSDLSIFDKMLSRINEGSDLVLASCYAKEGGVKGTTPLRLLLSKSANAILRFFIPIKDINTFSSFYRAYRFSAINEMYKHYGDKLIEEEGFECMVELLIKFAHNKKFKITEVPMILDGRKRIGKSKMKVLKTTVGFLKVILKDGVYYKLTHIFKKDEWE